MGQTGQDWTWNRASVASPRVGHSPLRPMTLLANSSYNDKVGSFPCCSVPSGGSGAGGRPHLLLGQSEGNCLVLWSDSKSQSPSVIPEHGAVASRCKEMRESTKCLRRVFQLDSMQNDEPGGQVTVW